MELPVVSPVVEKDEFVYCNECVYWVPLDGWDGWGSCRRHAPFPAAYKWNLKDPMPFITAVWLTTEGDGVDGCFEGKKKSCSE